MLLGRFGDSTGKPYIEARVVFPRFSIRGNISFLVDTGADRTYLHPLDGRKLGLDYSQLQPAPSPSYGIGGHLVRVFQEDAYIIFEESGSVLYIYRIPVLIAPLDNTAIALRVPSLLGRDILDRWRMTYAPTQQRYRLWFRVISADLTIPVS